MGYRGPQAALCAPSNPPWGPPLVRQKWHPCKTCKKRFKSKAGLVMHKRSKHGKGASPMAIRLMKELATYNTPGLCDTDETQEGPRTRHAGGE